MQIKIDPNNLTLAEVEDFEEATGIPIAALNVAALPTKALSAFIWIMMRRDDPSFTLADARAMRLADIGVRVQAAAVPFVASPEPEPSGSSPSSLTSTRE